MIAVIKMKRKTLILALVMMLFCSFTSVYAAEAGDITLTGTTSTDTGNLVLSTFSISGSQVDNFQGTITYDSSVLAVFKVEVNEDFENNYDYQISTSSAGTIAFSFEYDGDDSSLLINSDTDVFTVTFVVVTDRATSTSITTKSCSSTITTTEEVEEEDTSTITNQAEIDAANAHNAEVDQQQAAYDEAKAAYDEAIANGQEPTVDLSSYEVGDYVEVPDPVYATVTTQQEVVVDVDYDNSTQNVTITKYVSSDSYLKSLSIEGGSLSPSFSQGIYSYICTIDSQADIDISYTLSDPNSTVVIGEEVNNQISITVTAEDGTSNVYVITINRQDNYTPDEDASSTIVDDDTANDDNDDINSSSTLEAGETIGLDTITILVGALFIVIGLIGFTAGGFLIYKGAHNQ